MVNNTRHVKEPLIHLTRRMYLSPVITWSIRIGAFVLSILVCCLVSCLLSGKVSFGFFFKHLFEGAFGSTMLIKTLLRDLAIYLLLALAVTPCFEMRYWNIGGEGQAMMGAFGCALVVAYTPGTWPVWSTILLSFVAALVMSVVWAVVPALFKAKWNTNETLLTLMFNYIAICLGAYLIKKVVPMGTGILNFKTGTLAAEGVDGFWIIFITAVVMTVLMFIYQKYSKHGYEITVVGEAPNTARYVGINTKKVIVRTLLLCGIVSGIVGFMLVSVKDSSFLSDSTTQSTVAGRGFTAVLISWLAHFNPLGMALTSFLVVFITRGATQVGNMARLGNSYAGMMVGIFFFFIIATEFFINFKINIRPKEKAPESADPLDKDPSDKDPLDKDPSEEVLSSDMSDGEGTSVQDPEGTASAPAKDPE